jgi:hypothetical protein
VTLLWLGQPHRLAIFTTVVTNRYWYMLAFAGAGLPYIIYMLYSYKVTLHRCSQCIILEMPLAGSPRLHTPPASCSTLTIDVTCGSTATVALSHCALF